MLQSPASAKPWHVDQKVNLSVYPFHQRRKGVSQWNILFACVRAGHRYKEKQYLPHVDIRFAQVRPKGEFRAIAEEPSSIQVMPEKPVTPLIRILDLSTSHHTCVDMWLESIKNSKALRCSEAQLQ